MEVQAVMTSANERRKGYASALITVMTVEVRHMSNNCGDLGLTCYQ